MQTHVFREYLRKNYNTKLFLPVHMGQTVEFIDKKSAENLLTLSRYYIHVQQTQIKNQTKFYFLYF